MSNTSQRESTIVGKSAVGLIEDFSNKWNVTDDVANASIVDTIDEEVIRKKHVQIDADESVDRDAVLPISKYEQAVNNKRPLNERYSETPIGKNGTVEFIENGQTPRTCTKCSGQGTNTCKTCNGDGHNECPKCRGSLSVKCEQCEGEGTNRCPKCDGEGAIPKDEEMVSCPNCGGSGKTQCSRCSGSGNHNCPKCNGTGTVRCDECGGSGEQICARCDGDGEVVEATQGEISFTYSTNNEFETKRIPDRYVPEDGGTKVEST
ncbi:MAG: hypothetical protein ABEI86_12350, partial [Halobacteriaceae archaeon]